MCNLGDVETRRSLKFNFRSRSFIEGINSTILLLASVLLLERHYETKTSHAPDDSVNPFNRRTKDAEDLKITSQ